MAIRREFINKYQTSESLSIKKLAKTYDNMINSVQRLIENNSIYSTWIIFRVSKNDNEYVEFNNTSTQPNENLIVSLTNKKSGSGYANSFSLVLRYDPFNYGQNTTDSIEKLDNIIAEAMAADFDSDTDYMRAYLQYGYNCTDDTSLVSPKYCYIITSISSKVDTSTGLTTYTFEGTSELAADCNYSDSFPAVDNVNLVRHIGETLYKYYGDSGNVPSFMSGSANKIEPVEGSPKYAICIDEELIEKSITTSLSAYESMTPFAYCEAILLNKFNKEDSEKYQDISKIKDADKPKYRLFITDSGNTPTIKLSYVTPSSDNENISLSYEFTWGKEKQSIVTGWEPEVDLKLFVIQKSMLSRIQKYKSDAQEAINKYRLAVNSGSADIVDKKDAANTAVKAYEDQYASMSSNVNDYPSAKLSTVGIPSDIPITCEIKIIPRILESESRLAGYYEVTGCTDTFNSNGTYETTLDLFRLRGLYDSGYRGNSKDSFTSDLKDLNVKAEEAINKNTSEAVNNASSDKSSGEGNGGKMSGGGRTRPEDGGRRRRKIVEVINIGYSK